MYGEKIANNKWSTYYDMDAYTKAGEAILESNEFYEDLKQIAEEEMGKDVENIEYLSAARSERGKSEQSTETFYDAYVVKLKSGFVAGAFSPVDFNVASENGMTYFHVLVEFTPNDA